MIRVKMYFGFVVLSSVALIGLLLAGCTSLESPEGALSCCECLEDAEYDTEVRIFGEVSSLGELTSPSFLLSSGGGDILVWYDSMVGNDGTERPAVSVEGIKNGDRVIVTGELKGEGGTHYSKGDFWASSIEKY